MSPSLYFEDQHKKYLLVVRKDLYRGIVNPYFLELQQKYVVGEENCPYARVQKQRRLNHSGFGEDDYG